jgi:hypothetical protein
MGRQSKELQEDNTIDVGMSIVWRFVKNIGRRSRIEVARFKLMRSPCQVSRQGFVSSVRY